MLDPSFSANSPDFEQQYGRPPTALEVATRALWDAEAAIDAAQWDVAACREKLAVAELRLERKQRIADARRIERDEVALDELAASAPDLAPIDRQLLGLLRMAR